MKAKFAPEIIINARTKKQPKTNYLQDYIIKPLKSFSWFLFNLISLLAFVSLFVIAFLAIWSPDLIMSVKVFMSAVIINLFLSFMAWVIENI